MKFFPADITLWEVQRILSLAGFRLKSDRRGNIIVVKK
jgi:hypothetical protein